MTSLVLHAFAPLDGPASPLALHQLRALWTACGEVLGMDAPASGLPVTPPDWRGGPRVAALAARERRAHGFRAVLRRDRDVLVLSALLPGVGDAGWVELDRWLDDAAAGGVDALIGTARLYRMPAADPAHPPAEAALPPVVAYPGWQDGRVAFRGGRACAWELSSRQDTRRERRLVLAGADLDALTWGSGELPPFARYLMHAAVLRYHYRIWTGDQRRISALRDARAGRDLLRADLARLDWMHTTAATSLHALTEAVDEAGMRGDGAADPVTDDRQFGAWLTRRLDDARTGLDNLLRAAGGAAPLAPPATTPSAFSSMRSSAAPPARSGTAPPWVTGPAPGRSPGPAPGRPVDPAPGRLVDPVHGWPADAPEPVRPARARTPQHALRMSFTVDAVAYSAHDAKGREIVQQRISDVVGEALADLRLTLADTDHQGTGDGVNVVLPPDLELPRTLARLLHGTDAALRAERRRYAGPLRLRMGVSIGTFRVAALGWSDSTVIETSRLCDSPPVRAAMKDDPSRLFAAVVSERLHPFTVAEGHPELDPADFTPTEVTVKAYRSRAWLWTPAPR